MNTGTSYVFEQWEAIELFLRIISKHNRKAFSSTNYDNEAIANLVDKFIDQKVSKDFAQKTFGVVGTKNNSHERVMHNLSSGIRYDRPIIISADAFVSIVNYLEDSPIVKTNATETSNSKILRLYAQNRREKFILSSAQRDYENSNWFLYHYEQRYNVEANLQEYGLSRAVVKLKRYGRVEIDVYDQKHEQPNVLNTYIGKYRFIDNDRFLSMELKLAITFKKDLRLLFYTGMHSRKEFALGHYSNFGESIYSGTAIIKRATGKSTNLKPKFLKKDLEEDLSLVDPVVWKYFSEKYRNKSKVKMGLTSIEDFRKWWAEKNPNVQ